MKKDLENKNNDNKLIVIFSSYSLKNFPFIIFSINKKTII